VVTIRVRALAGGDLPWLRRLLQERWGGEDVVVHGARFRPTALGPIEE